MQLLDEFAAVIGALGAPNDRLAGLQAGQADPDALADRLPRKGEHSKAARRQVEQLGVERILPRLANARAAVDRRALRPAGVGARGGDGEGVAKIGSASWRERGCEDVEHSVVAVYLKKTEK